MARLYTPYRSLLSEADMEDTGGLLATPRSAPTPVAANPLAEQIRTLYGNRGDWNYGGIDRAAELADLLQKQGITDVSRIALQKGTRQEQQFSGGEDGQMNAVDLPANQVLFGDKRIGFAGDYNNDNTYGSNAGSYLQGDNTLGWSARGHGNVTYKVGTDAQGNNYLMPEWGSSSDMKDVRDAAKAAAVMAAMAYGVPMLGEAAGAAAGAGEAAAAGSLTAGVTPASVAAWEAALPTALSSAPLSTTLAAPLAELGSVGGLSETAVSTLPAMAAPTTAASTLASSPIGSLTDGITAESVANAEAALPKPLGPLDSFKTWATANPQLAKLLFSGAGALLSATGGGGNSGGGGYVDSGYRPTISRGGFNAAPQARQMAPQPTTGLLNTPTTGQPMSGLWRYGLLGG